MFAEVSLFSSSRNTQQRFTCLKSTIERLKKWVEYIQT